MSDGVVLCEWAVSLWTVAANKITDWNDDEWQLGILTTDVGGRRRRLPERS